jgi:hypothetical protein
MPKRRRRSRSKKRPPLRQSEDSRNNALHALRLMRANKLSLSWAARNLHVTPRTILKYAGRALTKARNGQYRAKPTDHLRRSMFFLTSEERIELVFHSSKTASAIGSYWEAVHRALRGDPYALEPFSGKSIKIGKATYPFVTDLHILKKFGNAGEVTFEEIYASDY